MTTGQLRAALRAMVLYLDPAAARRRAARGRADARVEAWQETSGNGALAGRELPAGDAVAADRRITAIARALQQAGAAGTLDQLRAAVFAALLAGRDPESLAPAPAPAAPSAGSANGQARPDRPASPQFPADPNRPGGLAALTGSVHLTMPLAAWLGLSDRPGEAAGLGPLDAWTCRDLAARLAAAGPATRWHLTLTRPDGSAAAHACARASPGPGPPRRAVTRWLAGLTFTPLEHGTCTHTRQVPGYRPANQVREHVRIRHRTCAFPGCRRPARACDLDHTIPHDQGGRTCECNLAPLCRRHHRAKQAPGWRLEQPEPGTMVWHLPHGRSYTVTPDPYLT
jgi:hypothetical protein